MKIYVEDLRIMNRLGYFSTPDSLKNECEEEGLFFSQNDMGYCYISENEDCLDYYDSGLEL